MKKRWMGLALCAALMVGSLQAADQMMIGVVNFRKCIDQSKLGKQEQATFEQMRDQMAGSMEKMQKDLQEAATKMGDQEYMDGLSENAKQELRNRYQTLNTEMMQNQSQFYQILNQAQTRMVQGIMDDVNNSSEKVAKAKGLKIMMADEAAFYYAPELDMTNQVVAEMDAHFTPSAPNGTPVKEEPANAPAAASMAPVKGKSSSKAK